MHPEPRGQQVVHHHDAHVLRVAAVAVQTEELGQQRPRVLKWKIVMYVVTTEFPIPTFIEVFRLSFREFHRLVGRYCT